MKSPSHAAIESELKRLKLDVEAHDRQIDTLWAGDAEMLRLLKAEESLLSKEIARLQKQLKTSRQ